MLNTILKTSRTVSQNIIRNYARRTTKRKFANPGIQKRINLLDERDEANLENVDVEELESDFMNIGEMHREHEKELNVYRDKEKYLIVKQKYFKENQLNFLTWNDKEQIRYLNQTNPTEWTIEKLSEGFPALPNTIAKILKSKWHKNESKKENHDKAVENNWKLLKDGKLNDTPPDLVKHLLKFTSRKPINHQNFQEKKVVNIERPKNGEFSSIIDSFQQLKAKSNKIEQTPSFQNVEDKLIDDSRYGNKMVPLRLIKKPEIMSKNETQETQGTIEEKQIEKLFHGKDASKNKYLTKTNEYETKKSLVVQYPEKIIIPKNKFKKGYLYKVNDCYYDDDGEFLYRVPGMY